MKDVVLLRETQSGITFAVRVQPRAKRNAILGGVGDALKIAVTAPPIDDRANQACVKLLADLLHVPRSSVAIVSGHSSRNKVIRVAGMTADAFRSKLQPSS